MNVDMNVIQAVKLSLDNILWPETGVFPIFGKQIGKEINNAVKRQAGSVIYITDCGSTNEKNASWQ